MSFFFLPFAFAFVAIVESSFWPGPKPGHQAFLGSHQGRSAALSIGPGWLRSIQPRSRDAAGLAGTPTIETSSRSMRGKISPDSMLFGLWSPWRRGIGSSSGLKPIDVARRMFSSTRSKTCAASFDFCEKYSVPVARRSSI